MALPVLEVHTPSNSFAIPHSLTSDNLASLFSRLSSKLRGTVGPGWVKYEYNGGFWDLDDDADYSIFAWRLAPSDSSSPSPVIYAHDPLRPLPIPPAYQNFSYYAFRPRADLKTQHHQGSHSSAAGSPARITVGHGHGHGPAGPFVPDSSHKQSKEGTSNEALSRRPTSASAGRSIRSTRSKRFSIRNASDDEDEVDANGKSIPKYKRDFLRFHGDNGVRVVVGTFGPVGNVEMLLKKGYRHVYMSRHFARRHGLVPNEVVPGWMGYGGLVNMGQIPITLGTKTTTHTVYLAEENQFDVVLGRSFMEARRVQTDPTDPSSVICQDNGDHLDCKIIVIRDGKGDFVMVP